jgi:4-amino-4-deoxy-L-arabinose transferase-like glycosyltransferase
MGIPVPATDDRGVRSDLVLLGILVLAAVALRGWQLGHTEVASRDSIGYIRIAWQLEHGPWGEAMRQAQQHPGYPLVLLAVSRPMRQFAHGDLATRMQWSAQLASALASVLLVVPMYYLGRELFDRRVAFWGTLLFQCLPASGRGMADGLSEPLFLLAVSAALWAACRGLRLGSVAGFALCGLCGGLAYLTRPEGALVVAATGVVLLLAQRVPGWRRPWRRVLACGAALVLTALAVGGPYAWTIGKPTVKHTAEQILLGPPTPGPAVASPGAPLAAWWPELYADPTERTGWAFVTVLEELSRAYFYVLWVPALLGLWWFRDRFRRVPGTWVLFFVCLPLVVLLYRVARDLGYLSDRHLVLVLLAGTYFTAAALLRIGELLASLVARWRPGLASPSLWASVVVAVACFGPLPRTLERLHGDRSGFRTAGCWLAEHIPPGDFVLDPYCWANYYAGRVFTEGVHNLPATVPPVFYLVYEEAENKHSRLREHNVATRMRDFGQEIHRFPVQRGKVKAAVIVYRMAGEWVPRP